MMGAVLQTVNVRLSPEQIAYTINHAKCSTLIVNDEFATGRYASPPLITMQLVIAQSFADFAAEHPVGPRRVHQDDGQ